MDGKAKKVLEMVEEGLSYQLRRTAHSEKYFDALKGRQKAAQQHKATITTSRTGVIGPAAKAVAGRRNAEANEAVVEMW